MGLKLIGTYSLHLKLQVNDMLSGGAVIEKEQKRVKLKLKQTRYVDKRSAVEMNADIRKAAKIKKKCATRR